MHSFWIKIDYEPYEETKIALLSNNYEEIKEINEIWK